MEAPRSLSSGFPTYPHTPQHHQHHLLESPPSVASIDASAAMFSNCGFNNFLNGYTGAAATPGNLAIPSHQEQAYTSPHHHAMHENSRHHVVHVDGGVDHIIDIPLYSNTQQYSPNSVQPYHQFVH